MELWSSADYQNLIVSLFDSLLGGLSVHHSSWLFLTVRSRSAYCLMVPLFNLFVYFPFTIFYYFFNPPLLFYSAFFVVVVVCV